MEKPKAAKVLAVIVRVVYGARDIGRHKLAEDAVGFVFAKLDSPSWRMTQFFWNMVESSKLAYGRICS
jgi:hypothetical protein